MLSVTINGHDGMIGGAEVLMDGVRDFFRQFGVAFFYFEGDSHVENKVRMRGAVHNTKVVNRDAWVQEMCLFRDLLPKAVYHRIAD